MAQMVILVIHNPGKVDAVVSRWVEMGVSGLTILDSSGWTQQAGRREIRDDLPLFPSLRKVLRTVEERNRTIFSVVPDDYDLDSLVTATETILGKLDDPATGILFTLPVTRSHGLRPKGSPGEMSS